MRQAPQSLGELLGPEGRFSAASVTYLGDDRWELVKFFVSATGDWTEMALVALPYEDDDVRVAPMPDAGPFVAIFIKKR